MSKIGIQKLSSMRKKCEGQFILFKLKITDVKENFFYKCMKSTDAIGRYRIDYSQSNRVKKINEYVTKSGN